MLGCRGLRTLSKCRSSLLALGQHRGLSLFHCRISGHKSPRGRLGVGRSVKPFLFTTRSISLTPLLYSQNSTPVSEVVETSTQSSWAEDAVQVAELAAKGDLASLGLGGHGPVGLLQTAIDALHTTCHLPWWAAIASATVVLRICLFPIVIRMQRNSANLNNLRPELDKHQKRIKEYQQVGNQLMVAQETARLLQLYQKHGCNPVKLMIMPFIQFPVFISFFLALRGMATVPIESMKEGGFAWFTDLTIPDPFYVLPFLGAFSFMATIEVSVQCTCCLTVLFSVYYLYIVGMNSVYQLVYYQYMLSLIVSKFSL